MAFLDAVLALCVFAFVYFVVIPALDKAAHKEEPPIKEDVGEVEKEVNAAIDTKKQADEVAAKAKKKAEDLLHKAEDLNKKL
jgi:F0F1-type ATP synthase membrane subunit b/b'